MHCLLIALLAYCIACSLHCLLIALLAHCIACLLHCLLIASLAHCIACHLIACSTECLKPRCKSHKLKQNNNPTSGARCVRGCTTSPDTKTWQAWLAQLVLFAPPPDLETPLTASTGHRVSAASCTVGIGRASINTGRHPHSGHPHCGHWQSQHLHRQASAPRASRECYIRGIAGMSRPQHLGNATSEASWECYIHGIAGMSHLQHLGNATSEASWECDFHGTPNT